MKILNQGNDWKRKIHCDYRENDFKCNCDFEVEFSDLIKRQTKTIPLKDKDYIKVMGLFYTFHVICPNCGNEIQVTNLPQQLFHNKVYNTLED